MYSGQWGNPVQVDIPPEPKITLKRAKLTLFGFHLSPINRYIDESRKRTAVRQFLQLSQEWDRQFKEIKLENQNSILEFERSVRDSPAYKAYLAEDRRWLEMVADAETKYQAALQRWNSQRSEFEQARNEEERLLGKLYASWTANQPEAITPGLRISLANSNDWWEIKSGHRVGYDPDTRILLIEFEFPDAEKLEFTKIGARNTLRPVAGTQRKRLQEQLIYGLALKVAFDLADITRDRPIDRIALNGSATFIDKATGRERTEIILSMLVKPAEVLELRLSHADPKIAFKKLKGVMTADLSEHSPVAPIMTIDKNDNRIVESRDVLEGLAENENLAAMDWADFEHLIRELFEKMFVQNGIEVKITRASRDSGVDAIAFDPNPLTGGKFVIQAKRYTRTVDVSAVRDLFGTLQNEGANRGILVTTSKFGRDTYEFANGKPITLIDGPKLLGLLLQHGYNFTIDLEAARRAGN
jgi:restriction system protein